MVTALDGGADQDGHQDEQGGGEGCRQVADEVASAVTRNVTGTVVGAGARTVAEKIAVHTDTLGRGVPGRAATGVDVRVSSWFAPPFGG
jgi:hypothetical protein